MPDLPLETELTLCQEKVRRLARQNRAILLSNRRLCNTLNQLAQHLAGLTNAPETEQQTNTGGDYRHVCKAAYSIVRQAQDLYDDTYGRPKRAESSERMAEPLYTAQNALEQRIKEGLGLEALLALRVEDVIWGWDTLAFTQGEVMIGCCTVCDRRWQQRFDRQACATEEGKRACERIFLQEMAETCPHIRITRL